MLKNSIKKRARKEWTYWQLDRAQVGHCTVSPLLHLQWDQTAPQAS